MDKKRLAQALKDAPGCFGSYVVHNPKHQVCAACEWKKECGIIARTKKNKVRESLGLTKVRERKKGTTPKAEKPRAEGLSKKGAALIDSLTRNGLDASQLRTVLNTDSQLLKDKKPAYIDVVVDAMRSTGAITKTDLRKVLIDKLKWGNNTAGSHVSIVVSAFKHWDLIEEDNETIKVKNV